MFYLEGYKFSETLSLKIHTNTCARPNRTDFCTVFCFSVFWLQEAEGIVFTVIATPSEVR